MPRLLIGCCLLFACSGDEKSPDTTDPGVDTVVDTVDTIPADTDPEPLTCASTQLESALEQMAAWPNLASCAHVWFGAMSESRNHALTLNLNMTDRNVVVGQEILHDFGKAGDLVGTLGLQVGTNLSRICALSLDTGEEPSIARSWVAEAGMLTLKVTSVDDSAGGDGPHPFLATMSLDGVVLRAVDSTGDRCPMPAVSWTDVPLGEMPQ